ncbi:MAG: hypothetical protein ACE5GC_10080 [Acidimicrobiia bacterium]
MSESMKGMSRAARRRAAALVTLATLAATLVVGTPAAAVAAVPEEVTFEGSGWGHGVGLSQFGAYGMAKVDGAQYPAILSHYFQGASVTTTDTLPEPPAPLWVNLEKDVTSITLIARKINYETPPGPTADLTLTRGADTRVLVENDKIDVTWVTDSRDCTLVHRNSGGAVVEDLGVGTCDLDLAWDGDAEQPTRKIEIEGCELTD